MRSAGNFNSEWGYLAPAPSFMRTARVVLVATAIGATAGAAVVLSLIDRPASERDKTASITAHAIVTSVQAAPAMATPAPDSASGALAAPVKVTTAVPPKPLQRYKQPCRRHRCLRRRQLHRKPLGCSAPCHASRDAAGRRDAVDWRLPRPSRRRKMPTRAVQVRSRSRAEAGSGICLAVGRAARDRSGACRARRIRR